MPCSPASISQTTSSSASGRNVFGSLLSAIVALILLAVPAFAQVDIGEDDMDFGPRTSAEQARLFDVGVAAYDEGNYASAFEIWLPLAQSGNMSAQRNVAHQLRRGLGVEQDHERAVYFYRRASESGLVGAMVNLAAMLRAGQGVEGPQYQEAGRWLYIAARAGDPRAQYVLGIMAARGQGMEANRELAIELFRLSAEQGLREARERLAEAGLEPDSIGDAPERSASEVPSELLPLPDYAPRTAAEPVEQPQLRSARSEPAAAQPVVAAAAPVATQPRAETRPVPVVTQAAVQPRAEPQPQSQPQSLPQAQPRAQAIPSVQSVSVQPTPTAPVRRAQPTVRSTSDLQVLPPAPSPHRAEPEPEEEAEPTALNRLLGGTR